MATNSSARHDTHSTTAGGGWSTKRIAVTALFCAVAAICTLFIEFPILPGVTFLKYDPSAIAALIAGFAFGPATGAVVSVLPYLVHLATESGIYGTLMAIIATRHLPGVLHPCQHRGHAHLHGRPARGRGGHDRAHAASVQRAEDCAELRHHRAGVQAHLQGA